MTKVISVLNHKGGVGKTTTTVNLEEKIPPTTRQWICPQCGVEHDCDVNAANLHKKPRFISESDKLVCISSWLGVIKGMIYQLILYLNYAFVG